MYSVEFGNGTALSNSSLKYWDTDTEQAFPGDHAWVYGGAGQFARIADKLAVPVQCNTAVKSIQRRYVGGDSVVTLSA